MILKIDLLKEVGFQKLLKACVVATVNNVREIFKNFAGWMIYGGYKLATHRRK